MLRRTFLAVLTAAALAVPAAAQQAPAPVEAFGRLPFTSAPKLSPDGKHFALIQAVNGRPAVAIYETNPTPGSKPAYIGSSEGIIDYIVWAKNDRLVVVAKQGITETFDRLRTWRRAFAVDVNGTNMVKLLRNMPSVGNNVDAVNIVDVAPEDPDYIYMAMWNIKARNQGDFNTRLNAKDDEGFKYDVVKVDIHSGKATIFQSGDHRTIGWLSDGHGTPVVKISRTIDPLKDHVSVLRDGKWTEIGAYDATADNNSGVAGLAQDGKSIIQFATNEQSLLGLVQTDIATGAVTPLFFSPGVDVSYVIRDEWTRRALGVGYIGDKLEQHYFDPKLQALQAGVRDAFPGTGVSIVSKDLSGNVVILAVEGPRQPTQYYILDRTTHQTMLLSGTYPGLQAANLGDMKPYPYTARDGLAIPAYLTLPPGKDPKKLPVVVMPHGGPDARDYIRFDWMAQFLANRGYAVLQPNFRGSDGYGHKFTEAGLQQWGLKIQDDITDGVKKLIADGVADPKRICIVGGSFGGYAALAGAAFTPDLYACAVSWAGVSDLPVQLASEVRGGGTGTKAASFWKSRMGDNMDKLAATSPARNAGKVQCPVLLLHGKNDTTVEIEQSEIMNDALIAAGKKVEFITYEGEDHLLELADTRIRVLKEMERFLKQNIGN